MQTALRPLGSPASRRGARAALRGAHTRVLWLALALAGCAGTQQPAITPEATVLELARVLNEGKVDAAYALMSPAYKQRVSLAQFQRQLGENPQEVANASSQLSHLHGPSRQQALVRYGDDGELQLTRVGDRWMIDSDVLSFYDQSTPRAALLAFVRAMASKRYDVVMRLIPNADKEGMTTDRLEAAWSGEAREELERMLTSLRDHRDDPIEVLGDHAIMPYGERRRVHFLLEDGVWKIEDPQ